MAMGPQGQREQVLLTVAILALAAVGAYGYFVFVPRSKEIAKTRARVQALASLNEHAKEEMAHGNPQDLRRELAHYRQNLELIRSLVPAGNEVPALLEQVSTAARRAGLDLSTVDPQPVVRGDNYDTYRYGIALVGGYHSLATFLTNVGSLTRIVLPVDLTLQLPTNAPAGSAKADSTAAAIEARFQLETFVVHKPANDGSGAKPGAKT